ncbi:hypothetical protein [Desulfospira joergensenii]|uniref:hypothetical protein n=1 Tax=Desulfospira joergensenii TaxID=53329 RepID=UPI0003B66047|nr:hypothetical protein [Desulfospira joergensenii]
MEINTRYFKVAGLTFQINSDLPIFEDTFAPKFKVFETNEPGTGGDMVIINHCFKTQPPPNKKGFEKIYHKIPWTIYRHKNGWIYQRIHIHSGVLKTYCTAFLNHAHTRVDIYHNDMNQNRYKKGHVESLTLFPTDQVLLARLLADRKGCFFHSNGIVFNNKGMLFLGHSGFGKSTLAKMLKSDGGKILCDDRMIAREYPAGIKIYGNWCHGKEQIFSADSSSLNALFFITKSKDNRIVPVDDIKSIVHNLFSYIVRPIVTKDWWISSLLLMENMARQIPCYNLMFDKSGRIVPLIDKLLK